MERACYQRPGGPLVTVEQFLGRAGRDYKARGIHPYCPACQERVAPYGAHSVEVTSRFDHSDRPAGLDPADDCPLANRNDPRFRWLVPADWDFDAGVRLRAAFFEDENLKTAYPFSLHLCGRGNLSADQFKTLVRRADRKNIWCYAGMQLWIIPYILLTLGDFNAISRRTNRPYGFHFVLNKPRRGTVESLWLTPAECQLVKLFSSNNTPEGAEAVAMKQKPKL